MNFIISILSILLFVSVSGCKKVSQKTASSPEEVTSLLDTLTSGREKFLLEYGENQVPRNIFPLNANLLKEGYAFGYKPNGGLERIAHWSKGNIEGETYLFENGVFSVKEIFDSGVLIYQADYLDHIKVENRLYPQILEEFFFEDKYYAKIKFPIHYQGDLEVVVVDFQAVVRPSAHQAFQLVINDALDLSSYTLKLSYHPADQDSLVRSDYRYTQVVFED